MIRPIIATYRAAFSGLSRSVWVLCFVTLVNRAGAMVLPFMSLYLIKEHGINTIQVGVLLSVYGLGSAVGSYLGGWLTDRIGAMAMQKWSLFLTGLGFLWFLSLDTFVTIAIGMFVLSVVADALRPAVMAAMGEVAPPELAARAFALLRLAINVGMMVGPVVGGLLASISYSWLFIIDAVTCWGAGILLAVMLPGQIGKPVSHAVRKAASSPWRDGPFLLLLGLVMVLAIAFFQFMSTMPIYYNKVYLFQEGTIGVLLALNAVIIVLFEMVLVHWAEKHDTYLLTGLGACLVCFGFGLMPLGTSFPFVACTVVVWTVGEMLSLPLINALVADRAGPTNRGRYMGLYTTTYSLAFIAGPAAGTCIYETCGPNVLWFAVGALGVPLGLGFVWLRNRA